MGNICEPKISDSSREKSYYRDPEPNEPLSKQDIESRIVSSDHTETMKVNASNSSFSIAHAYLSQRGYYPHALDKANQVRRAFESVSAAKSLIKAKHGRHRHHRNPSFICPPPHPLIPFPSYFSFLFAPT